MTDREALEEIARIVRSADDAIHARWKVGAVIDRVLGVKAGKPLFDPPVGGK